VTAVSVQQQSQYCPPWLGLSLLERVKAEQYLSKNSLSDYAVAQTLAHTHRKLVPIAGKYGDIEIVHLKEACLRRYLGTALQESRRLDLKRFQFVHHARHPPGQRGSALGHCAVCSEGVNPLLPLPAKTDAAGNSTELLHPSEDISRCGKVRTVRPMPVGMRSSRCKVLQCER
jgi:hypothetical protein